MKWPWTKEDKTAESDDHQRIESLDTRLTMVELRLKAVEVARTKAAAR